MYMDQITKLLEVSLSALSTLRKWISSLILPTWSKIILPLLVAAIAIVLMLSSCGVTRTSVRTYGKGATNATISVTTNNPTSVSVETKLDSTKLTINKQDTTRK